MASITLPERSLHTRANTLHELFAPLRAGKSRVAIGPAKDSPGGTIALVATDARTSGLRYREGSFSTSAQVLRCRYFELWRGSSGRELALDRAYFTLLKILPATHDFQELLCIHTDPADKNNLKRGPHLHVSCAPDPLPHCHFPLEFGFLEAVLRDCGSLTSAMQRAIGLVARDVLPKFSDR